VSFLGNATGNRPQYLQNAAGKKAGVLPLPGLGRSTVTGGRLNIPPKEVDFNTLQRSKRGKARSQSSGG
jgi:hypothetical protein